MQLLCLHSIICTINEIPTEMKAYYNITGTLSIGTGADVRMYAY